MTFPGTPYSRCSVCRHLPKEFSQFTIFYPKFFPMTFFKVQSQKIPFSSRIFDLFLVIYHKNNLSPLSLKSILAIFNGFYTFLMFLSKRCRVRHDYFIILIGPTIGLLTYKIYFRNFHFPVRRTGAYRHKKPCFFKTQL